MTAEDILRIIYGEIYESSLAKHGNPIDPGFDFEVTFSCIRCKKKTQIWTYVEYKFNRFIEFPEPMYTGKFVPLCDDCKIQIESIADTINQRMHA